MSRMPCEIIAALEDGDGNVQSGKARQPIIVDKNRFLLLPEPRAEILAFSLRYGVYSIST